MDALQKRWYGAQDHSKPDLTPPERRSCGISLRGYQWKVLREWQISRARFREQVCSRLMGSRRCKSMRQLIFRTVADKLAFTSTITSGRVFWDQVWFRLREAR